MSGRPARIRERELNKAMTSNTDLLIQGDNMSRKKRKQQYPSCRMVCDIGADGLPDLWVIFNGIKIAKRGRPDSPQAKTWVSIEPGYVVRDGKTRPDGGGEIFIEYNGVSLQ